MCIDDKWKDYFLALLILNIPKFSNSYELIIILERNFKYFNPRYIIDDLLNKKMIREVDYIYGVNHFLITEEGYNFMFDYLNNFKDQFLKDYNENHIIYSLIKNVEK